MSSREVSAAVWSAATEFHQYVRGEARGPPSRAHQEQKGHGRSEGLWRCEAKRQDQCPIASDPAAPLGFRMIRMSGRTRINIAAKRRNASTYESMAAWRSTRPNIAA